MKAIRSTEDPATMVTVVVLGVRTGATVPLEAPEAFRVVLQP